MKKVRFNGMTTKCYGCTNPRDLIVGEIYFVTTEINLGWQLNYSLKGFPGEYNAKWFTILEENAKEPVKK